MAARTEPLPAPVSAAAGLTLLIAAVWFILAFIPDENGGGLILPLIGVALAVFVAVSLLIGNRRGQQLAAIMFCVLPISGLLVGARLGLLTAAMGVGIIVLLTVPARSRAWFGYGHR